MAQDISTVGKVYLEAEDDKQPRSRVSVAQYSAGEVIQQFIALYNCLDFENELSAMDVGRFQIFRRKKARLEFKALAVALWAIALQKSFPVDAGNFLAEFRTKFPDLTGRGKAAERFIGRLDKYIELLEVKKDTDFQPVAEYLVFTLLPNDKKDFTRLHLKLSLLVRNLYVRIFNKLV